MSDEQWLWLFVHQRIDAEEKLEKMCPKCRDEVTSEHRCIRCGKEIIEEDSFVNPNFDMDRYNELAGFNTMDIDDDEDDNEIDERDISSSTHGSIDALDDDEYYEEDE